MPPAASRIVRVVVMSILLAGCSDVTARVVTLGSHASVTFVRASHPVLIAGSPPSLQPLPASRYYASVNIGVQELVAGTTEMPAGELVIAQ